MHNFNIQSIHCSYIQHTSSIIEKERGVLNVLPIINCQQCIQCKKLNRIENSIITTTTTTTQQHNNNNKSHMEINVGRAYFSLGTHVVLLYVFQYIDNRWSSTHHQSDQWFLLPVNKRGRLKNVFKTSFVRYGCQKDVSYTSCVHWDGLERMAFFSDLLIYGK